MQNYQKRTKKNYSEIPVHKNKIKDEQLSITIWKFFLGLNVWSNNLPSKTYFAFISQSAINGSYTKNIFNFRNLAEEIALYVNGKSIPARLMRIDVGTNRNHVNKGIKTPD